MAKAYAEGLHAGGRSPEGGREGGDSRGKKVGESIPDGWRPEDSPPTVRRDAKVKVGGIGDCEREREREREREEGGRESDRESESQGEGGKKKESLYLMVGGQRANTSPEAFQPFSTFNY